MSMSRPKCFQDPGRDILSAGQLLDIEQFSCDRAGLKCFAGDDSTGRLSRKRLVRFCRLTSAPEVVAERQDQITITSAIDPTTVDAAKLQRIIC